MATIMFYRHVPIYPANSISLSESTCLLSPFKLTDYLLCVKSGGWNTISSNIILYDFPKCWRYRRKQEKSKVLRVLYPNSKGVFMIYMRFELRKPHGVHIYKC
jgi:hypothetical protein